MTKTVETEKVEKRGAHLKVPDHLKVEKKVYVPTGNPRGRKKGQTKGWNEKRGAHLKVPDHLKVEKMVYVPTGNPRANMSDSDSDKASDAAGNGGIQEKNTLQSISIGQENKVSRGKRKQSEDTRGNENSLKRKCSQSMLDKKAEKGNHLWEGFIIFSQFKATQKYGWTFNQMRSWNPYTANINQVSMFLQILKCQKSFSDEDLEVCLNKILDYLPELRGKEMPEVHVEEDVQFLINLICKDKPLGFYPNLKRYNGDIWASFVIYFVDHVKEDPFLAMPRHVKDFIMDLFEERDLPSILLENYADFYCGNVVNICKNLGFYLKFEYDGKSLLESKPIKEILDIFYSLDQKLNEPAGQSNKKDSDYQNMIPKNWYVNYNAKEHSKDFWSRGLVRNILMDVKNKVLSEGEAAWELGVTIDMISCAVQNMEPDKEFLLTVKQYVEQGFGSEDKFWEEESTKILLDDLKNRVTDVDTVAFQLGISSANVLKKAGRIKTRLEIEEERRKMRFEKQANAPPKLTPLELQVQIIEKNKDSMSDYEKMRLENMKERLSLFNSLDIQKDKKSLKSTTPLKPFSRSSWQANVVEPRKKSSRIKNLTENKESLKVEKSLNKKHARQSPLWVGRRTPKSTADPIELDSKLVWELIDKSEDQLSHDELSAIIPVPKLTIGATQLIANGIDYYNGTRFLNRLESEMELCGSASRYMKSKQEKSRKEHNIGNWIDVGGGIGSNDEIISMAMSEELIAYGDMGGGLGFWLGEKRLLLRPHNMPVCRTFFIGSGSSTNVVTASHDGTVRVFDANKQEFSLAYSWNKQYKFKQGVVWLEPVDQNLWLVNCEEGDLLNLDRRDRKVNKILALPKSRRSCQSQIMISPENLKKKRLTLNETMKFFATPALIGSNIAINPTDSNLISLCDDETVVVYDRRNFQKPISTISTASKFDSSTLNSSLNHHGGSSWSQSGKHFVTYERNSISFRNRRMKGSFNLYLNAQVADDHLVPQKINGMVGLLNKRHNPIFSSGEGIVWSPWQEDVFYYLANKVIKKNPIKQSKNRRDGANATEGNGMVIGVDVNSGDVMGKLNLPTQASNMMGFHPTRPQLVLANLNKTGDIVIYKEDQGSIPLNVE